MTRRQGLALAVALVTGALVAAVSAATGGTEAPSVAARAPQKSGLTIQAGPATLVVGSDDRRRMASEAGAAAWLARHNRFSGRWTRGRLAWRGADAALLARAASGDAANVRLQPVVREIALDVPLVRQAYRNNCETAALSMALRGRVNQRRLQRLIPLDGPLDPIDGPAGREWGDPSRGFVGRVEGGGFGVYEGPLAALGARFDPGTTVLRARDFDDVLDQLRLGRPVVLWAALGASSPTNWRTAQGITVQADLAEHTIVLVGLTSRGVVTHDPWTGRVVVESASALAGRWRVLGRRALATSARPARLTQATGSTPP